MLADLLGSRLRSWLRRLWAGPFGRVRGQADPCARTGGSRRAQEHATNAARQAWAGHTDAAESDFKYIDTQCFYHERDV